MLYRKIFATNLKRIRKERGLTQMDMAELGFNQQSLSEYEQAKRIPNDETVKRLLKALNTTEEELFLPEQTEETDLEAVKRLLGKLDKPT